MTEEEVDAVAEELARAGGVSWYPGRTDGPLLRPVGARYRSRARAAISALDRLRASRNSAKIAQAPSAPLPNDAPGAEGLDELHVGAIVMYRPPGDKRAVACKVEQLENGRAYLVPCPKPDLGWISLDDLSPLRNDRQSA